MLSVKINGWTSVGKVRQTHTQELFHQRSQYWPGVSIKSAGARSSLVVSLALKQCRLGVQVERSRNPLALAQEWKHRKRRPHKATCCQKALCDNFRKRSEASSDQRKTEEIFMNFCRSGEINLTLENCSKNNQVLTQREQTLMPPKSLCLSK